MVAVECIKPASDGGPEGGTNLPLWNSAHAHMTTGYYSLLFGSVYTLFAAG